MSFKDKVVLVTGAGSGIGADAARKFASLSAHVALVDCNESRLNGTKNDISKAGYPAPLVIVADVTTDSKRIIDETLKHFGKLNILINSAGIGIPLSIQDADIDVFDRTMKTNVRSIVELTKLAVPHLAKTKGNIVNVSSIAGMVPYVTAPYYSMSKAALDQFTRIAAVQFGPFNIRVNSINPGLVDTPFFENNGYTAEKIAIHRKNFENRLPLKRIGHVDDTTAAIIFLANDDKSSITGILLQMDCGAVAAGIY